MAEILDYALAYAAAGLPVFRLSKSKVPLKGTHGHLDATTDPALIRSWFENHDLNLGIACGDIVVLDLDGADALTSPWGKSLAGTAAANGGLPETRVARTRRGVHLYFRAPSGSTIRTRNEPRRTAGDSGVDIKAHGGYVVLPPSISKGFTYRWANDAPIAELPPWLITWIEGCGGQRAAPAAAVELPAHLAGRAGAGLAGRASLSIQDAIGPEDLERIRGALAAVPADGYDTWFQVGLSLYSLGDWAFDLFDDWSAAVPSKYSPEATERKWASFSQSARGDIGLGTLFHLAKQAGWEPPARYVPETVPEEHKQFQTDKDEPQSPFGGKPVNGHHLNGTTGVADAIFTQRHSDNPLQELNEKFAVIGNLGGKVMVLEWITSPADATIKIPSFQTFKSISERYSNRYVNVLVEKKTRDGEVDKAEESKQVGAYWLKWSGRTTYEGLDLDPHGPTVLPGKVLNMWNGFGVAEKPGKWPLMRQHIAEVLANGDTESAAYIVRWAAWSVQNPGEPAEVALVFRGDKGTGKGTFAHAMRRLFGQHGVYISNSKHMVGQFNGHLRTCILLLADEAFWAGDKQGQSTLQAMLTEPVIMVENKGVDASQWKNRLHVIMLANAEWVVPASSDERRYAVFNVGNQHRQSESYFKALRGELDSGGLEAMLHDLMTMELAGWHPRKIVKTVALQQQKEASLNALQDWYVALLQSAYLPGTRDSRVPAAALLHVARDSTRRLQDLSPQGLGRFLKKQGCKAVHTANGSAWEFPALADLRVRWEHDFGAWPWEVGVSEWRIRS